MVSTQKQIQNCIIRFDEMTPCKTAFIDARTPGSDKKENFCLIGQGVAENPDQIVHIDRPHGFNIGAARQPRGCKNSHHSHNTEEVFMVHKGSWEFTWGEDGSDGSAVLHAGDTISVPIHFFRGFENVGEDDGIMFSILGLDDSGTAGHVLWAPQVFRDAQDYGLVLLEDGRLIDTAAGVEIPQDGKQIKPTTAEQAASMKTLSAADMAKCVATKDDLASLPTGGLSTLDGIREIAVIGTANSEESIAAGKMDWPHNFQMRRIQIEPGASIPIHVRAEEEVVIVQEGRLKVSTPELEFSLDKGDLFTAPVNMKRSYTNTSKQMTDIIVIRRGNSPQAAKFI